MVEKESLRAAAEAAVFACVPLLPLTGSYESGYRPTAVTDLTLRATAEEWMDAAHVIAELHDALRREGAR